MQELSKTGARTFLERLSRAMVAGDSKSISKCFDLPAMYVSDDDVSAFTDRLLLEQLFAEGHKFYDDKGITDTRPEIEEFTKLSPRLYETKVSWPGFDAAGKTIWIESSKYLIRLDDDGQPRIRVAETLGGQDVKALTSRAKAARAP